jgi:glycosyltransferase involved in cell wall biosynthesis
VPRKGFDVAIRAVARMRVSRPDLVLAISGGGRDDDRLRRLAADLDAPVLFLGRVPNDDLPALYGCADVYTMLCRNRWGGLEQEGFGIVFVEAAACGVPQIAGASGGAAEAVAHGDARSSRVVGRRIEQIDLPRGATIGAIVRLPKSNAAPHAGADPAEGQARVIMAHHDTVIEADDHVIVFVENKRMIPKVEKLFQVGVGFF